MSVGRRAKNRALRAAAEAVARHADPDRIMDLLGRANRIFGAIEDLQSGIWHFSGLPSGKDVRQLARQVGRLRRQVAELERAVTRIENAKKR